LTLGALFKICNERDKVELKNKLGLNKESKALLILTEGSLDKNLIQKALWEDVNS
jgi:hypothetical protein